MPVCKYPFVPMKEADFRIYLVNTFAAPGSIRECLKRHFGTGMVGTTEYYVGMEGRWHSSDSWFTAGFLLTCLEAHGIAITCWTV